MYVNLVLAIPAAVGRAAPARQPTPRRTSRPRIDLPGTLTASAGLLALVYGFSNAETDGWGSPRDDRRLAAGVALLAAFVAVERRVEHPLLPLRVVADRARGGAFLAIADRRRRDVRRLPVPDLLHAADPRLLAVITGLAFLPMMAMLMPAGAIGQTRLLPRFGPRPLVAAGMLLGAGAMLCSPASSVDSSYATDVLPGAARARPRPRPDLRPGDEHRDARRRRRRDAGVASAMVNTGQQVGGSIGTALLSTLAASAAPRLRRATRRAADVAAQAAVHGYTTAFSWSAAIFAVGALICVAAAAVRRSGARGRRRRRAGVRALMKRPLVCKIQSWRPRSREPEAMSSARFAARRSSTPRPRCSRRCRSPTSR